MWSNERGGSLNIRALVGGLFLLLIIGGSLGFIYYLAILKPEREEFISERERALERVKELLPEKYDEINPKARVVRGRLINRIVSARTLEEIKAVDLETETYLERSRTELLIEVEKEFKGPPGFMEKCAEEKNVLVKRIREARTVEELSEIDVKEVIAYCWRDYRMEQLLEVETPMVILVKREKGKAPEMISLPKDKALELINAYAKAKDIEGLRGYEIAEDLVATPLILDRRRAGGGIINEGYVVDVYTEVNGTKKAIVKGALVVAVIREDDSGSINLTERQRVEESGSLSESKSVSYEEESISESRNISGSESREKRKEYSVDLQEVLKAAAAGKTDPTLVRGALSDYGYDLSINEGLSDIGELNVRYLVVIVVPSDVAGIIDEEMDKVTLMPKPFHEFNDWYFQVMKKIGRGG